MPVDEIPVDEDRDEIVEEMTLEARKEALQGARWNVFMFAGLAALMFLFALIDIPFEAEYQGFSATEQINPFGIPMEGEDLFDIPVDIEVIVENPPAQAGVLLAAYVVQADDCNQQVGDQTAAAREGGNHAYQHQTIDNPIARTDAYSFEFQVDPGTSCVIVQFEDADGRVVTDANTRIASVSGGFGSLQVIGGVLGTLFLGLTIFGFIGAQKIGNAIKEIEEGGLESTESQVLAEVASARIAAGPTGAPPAAGPSGPPTGPTAGPEGAPEEATSDEAPSEAPAEAAPAEAAPAASEGEATFEPAENGYFFRKLPDGTYDQTVYVQAEDGSYQPHQG